jgi:hypothetical protein
MNLDDLKTEWRTEMERASQMSELRLDVIKGNVSEIHRAVRLRDVWFLLVLVLGSTGTVFIHWLDGDSLGWLSQLGILILVVASATIAFALLTARKVTNSDAWTLRSRLESEIEQLEKQEKLAYSVGSWFLAPMLPAIVFLSLGGYHDRTGSYVPDLSLSVYYLACIAVYGLTFWLCRREAKRSLGPLLTKLRRLHRALVEDSAVTSSS